jgi:outer membrane protein assembly factor BamB
MAKVLTYLILPAAVLLLLTCGGGPVVWTAAVPCDPGAVATGIAKAGPNIAVVGTKVSPGTGSLAMVVQMFDDKGQIRWRREYTEGETNVAGGVALNRRGEAFIAGGSRINGRDMCVVAKYRIDGNLLWQRALAVGDGCRATGIAVVPEGLLVCGSVSAKEEEQMLVVLLDENGETVWTRNFRFGVFSHAAGVAADDRGNMVLGGQTGLAENPDIIVAKLDKGGDTLWTRRYDSGGEDRCGGVAIDVFGNVLATGMALDEGSPRCVILEYHPDGELIRKSAYGERTAAEGRAIATTPEGDIFVAGAVYDGQQKDLLAFQYKPGATSVWERNYRHGDRNTTGAGIVADGDVFVLGTVEDGPGSDMVLARLFRPVLSQ